MQLRSAELASSKSEDTAKCRALLHCGSRTFLAASHFLPRHVADAACALYAFCRLADDSVDVGDDTATALLSMRRRLDAIYQGRPQSMPVDRALARVVHQYAIPVELPVALLEGFEWDTQGKRYETLGELYDYAARVAGTVGAMMCHIMGCRDPRVIARACELGVAMQLSNIARDVGEDARLGRIYLPLAWFDEVGLDPLQWLSKPMVDERVARMIRRLLDQADQLYAQAALGIAHLPWRCRAAIQAARILYAEIGQEVRRRDYDAVSQRACVSSKRKLWCLLTQLPAALLAKKSPMPLALPAIEFLSDPGAWREPVQPGVTLSTASPGGARASGSAVTVLELFMRLQRRDASLQSTATRIRSQPG